MSAERMTMIVFAIVMAIHIAGAIVAIIIHYKNGAFEWSSRNGDGFRYATPADIVFNDLVLWEINLLMFAFDSTGALINNSVQKKYSDRRKDEK